MTIHRDQATAPLGSRTPTDRVAHSCGRVFGANEIDASVPNRRRNGFTLVEVLVVIAILVSVASFTAWQFSDSRQNDRISAAARQIQSEILGSHDRATAARESRGLRLIRDEENPLIVTGLARVQPAPRLQYGVGSFQLERRDDSPRDGRADSPEILSLRSHKGQLNWIQLQQKGLLTVPFRVRIPAVYGDWFTVSRLTSEGAEVLATLRHPFAESDAGYDFDSVVAVPPESTRATCEIDLGWNGGSLDAPSTLPAGVVIDLKFSRLWSGASDPATPLHLVTSRSGTLSAGNEPLLAPVLLVLRDRRDADLARDPADPQCASTARGLLILPQTGRVQSVELDLTDDFDNVTQQPGPDGQADNLYRLALTSTGVSP